MANDLAVRHPEIKIDLVGQDGNAFAIMGRVTQAMQRGGCTKEEIKQYTDQATSGDYDNLLRVTMETVNCDDYDDDYDDYDDDDYDEPEVDENGYYI